MTLARKFIPAQMEEGDNILMRGLYKLYDPLFASPSVRHILVRHEQGAGHAATGYAQVTGRPGVCMATSGPGALPRE